jgi:hypothetical protein
MPPKKPAGNVVQAEVALKQTLKNCLVNLPSTLVSVLVNANAVSGPIRAMRQYSDYLLDRAKCRRRTLIPPASPSWCLRFEECLPFEVGVRGLDWHAKPT